MPSTYVGRRRDKIDQIREWLRHAVPHLNTCPGCEADYSHKWEDLEHEHDCPLVAFLKETQTDPPEEWQKEGRD